MSASRKKRSDALNDAGAEVARLHREVETLRLLEAEAQDKLTVALRGFEAECRHLKLRPASWIKRKTGLSRPEASRWTHRRTRADREAERDSWARMRASFNARQWLQRELLRRKLEAMTVANGCTPQEAAVAAAKLRGYSHD